MIDSSTTTIDRADPHEAVVDSCYQDLLLLANDSSALCNGSGLDVLNDTVDLEIDSVNGTRLDVDGLNNWWAMLALVLVLGTAAGNILVCLAIARERRLQNVTNYFLMSLAITDLLVAVLVMPLGILTLVRVAQIDSKQSGCKCNKVINVPYKFSLENPPNSSFHFKLVATYREHSAIHKSRRELKNTHNTWTNFSSVDDDGVDDDSVDDDGVDDDGVDDDGVDDDGVDDDGVDDDGVDDDGVDDDGVDDDSVDDDGVDDDGVDDDGVDGDDVGGLLMSGQIVKLGTLNDQSQTFSFEFQTNRFPLPRSGHSKGHIIFVHL
ncbi:Dopamine D2 receptor [Apis cerana cerana]|uniref:Dopamine D2 receptor n=1 Tax=Apis cerana cerana TaxID=94128 RepID=A0A2A3E2C8_APICC|nr:Dopamine D2 receptor [Apis cerana cerana]